MHFKELVQKQRNYFLSGATRPVEFRKQQLQKLKKLVVDNKDAFVEAIYKDLRRSKPYASGEIDQIANEIDYFLANLDEWVKPEEKGGDIASRDFRTSRALSQTKFCRDVRLEAWFKNRPSARNITTRLGSEPFGKVFVYKIPLGVVLVISPFNFPISLALRPLAAALAAGNTCVLKPSELSENAATLLNSTLSSVFPTELVAVVEGDAKVSSALLEERYDHIFYTGSPAIGRIVMTAAAQHLTPVTLELGGKCPTVVLDDSNLEKAVEKIVNGKYYNSGQVCLAVDYVLCDEKIKDKFLSSVKEQITRMFGEKPKESDSFARLINTNHFNRVQKLIKSTNGKLVYQAGDLDDHDAKYIAPRVYEVQKDDSLMEDEIFGPVLCVLPVKSFDEAIEFINQGEKPLGAYIFTEDQDKVERFFSEVNSGNTVSNGVMLNYASIKIPFGGVGQSGIGRYHGKYGFETFSHSKASVKASL